MSKDISKMADIRVVNNKLSFYFYLLFWTGIKKCDVILYVIVIYVTGHMIMWHREILEGSRTDNVI